MNSIWYQKNHPLAYLLSPLSGLYRSVVGLRKLAYQKGIFKIHSFDVPVIVVGNITIGGTGKTPLIIAVARFLSQQGYKPGIVSRGYGGNPPKLPLEVTPDITPEQAGDEPVLIALKTRCPVVIDPDRVSAVKTLLKMHSCDVVLSDDGLQHTRLGRSIEIAVVDGIRRFGNGFCLPAGPLREPVSRLKEVNIVVARDQALPGEHLMQLVPGEVYNLLDLAKKIDLTRQLQPIHAVAGIGNPASFFNTLRALNVPIIEHPFPDHHFYKPDDLDFGPNALIIMTEKDAVKCRAFADSRYWCLSVQAECASILTSLLSFLRH